MKIALQFMGSLIFLVIGFAIIPNPTWYEAICCGAASMMISTIYVETVFQW